MLLSTILKVIHNNNTIILYSTVMKYIVVQYDIRTLSTGRSSHVQWRVTGEFGTFIGVHSPVSIASDQQ